MATINFANLKQDFSMESEDVSVGQYIRPGKAYVEWDNPGDNLVRFTGSDFVYSQGPKYGTVNGISIDLGNDLASKPDITLTGLSADYSDFYKLEYKYAYSASEQREQLWGVALAGDDTFNLGNTGRNIDMYGDGVSTSDVVIAGNDTISGSAGTTWGSVCGDIQSILFGAHVSAGDDKLVVSARFVYGDVLSLNGSISCGNDTISPYVGGAITFIYADVGDVGNGATAAGGDDIITLSATTLVYGDAYSVSSGGRMAAGDDRITGGSGSNTIYADAYGVGSSGFTAGTDTVHGGEGNDLIYGDWKLNSAGITKGGNDKLYGDGGNDTIFGNAGNDYINGGSGADYMEGGFGKDTYVVQNTGDVVAEETTSGGNDIDTVQSSINYTLGTTVENLTLTGTGVISGTGNLGANIIAGNAAKNTLKGNGGNDIFLFNTVLNGSNYDKISDFDHASDTFQLDNAVFKGRPDGALASYSFQIITSGTSKEGVDSNDYILYDKTHGDLYFDRDGSGSTYSRVFFAYVADNTNLDSTDFTFV